jgi:hypothetical protein
VLCVCATNQAEGSAVEITLLTFKIGILVLFITEVAKGIFQLIGKPIPASVQFLFSAAGSILPVLLAGHTQTVAELSAQIAALFATIQGLYNVYKQLRRIFLALFG